MEPKDTQPGEPKNLLDKIASDPEIINRGAAEPLPVAPVPAAPTVQAAAGSPVPAGGVMQFADKPSGGVKAPQFNLLHPQELAGAPVPAATGTSGAAKPKHGHRLAVVVIVLAVLLAGGGAAGYMLYVRPNATQVAVSTPAPTPTPTATPTPTPSPTETPTPTPSPSPAPTPEQVTVTAPAAVPTVEHPQTVTVKSKSGLWHRSTPSSANQKNVIGWIPYNAQVSVDATGDFWWHGTYNGKSGYFAVNYTK